MGCAMCRWPSPGPVCFGARLAPEWSPRLKGFWHSLLPLPGLPVTGFGGSVPPMSGFGRFRHLRVIENAHNPLTSKEETHHANHKPVAEVRIGRVKAAIWRNGTEGRTRHNVTFSRLYKDGEQWKTTQSFGSNDLLVLAKVADWATRASSSFSRKTSRRRSPGTQQRAARLVPAAIRSFGKKRGHEHHHE